MAYICLSAPLALLAPWARVEILRLAEIMQGAARRRNRRVRLTRTTPDLLMVRNSCSLVSLAVIFPREMEEEVRLANGEKIPIFILWSRGQPPAARVIRGLPELVEFQEWSRPGEALDHFQRFLIKASGEALGAAETRDERGLTSRGGQTSSEQRDP